MTDLEELQRELKTAERTIIELEARREQSQVERNRLEGEIQNLVGSIEQVRDFCRTQSEDIDVVLVNIKERAEGLRERAILHVD